MKLLRLSLVLISMIPLHAFAEEKPLSGDSVYQLGSSWRTQEAKTIRLPALRGKPRLMTMVYTSCQYSCPMAVEELRNVLKELPESERARVGVTLVSFDSERDTPEQMRKFAEKKGLDPATWTFLTGSSESVREVAAVLGISYKKADGEYSHTNGIAVLDSEGVIRYKQASLGGSGKETAAELKKLVGPATQYLITGTTLSK